MDKKFFTCFNSKEAEPYIGKECRFANYGTLLSLNKGVIGTLSKIKADSDYPFACGSVFYQFCTPVEKKFRPYKDFEEMVEDAVKHGSNDSNFVLVGKRTNEKYLTALRPKGVLIPDCSCLKELKDYKTFKEMAELYTWLDGAPCGVEEEV